MSKSGLGKGLGAIFGDIANPTAEVVEPVRSDEEKQELPLKDIIPNPHQPRQVFDADKLAELVESIKRTVLFSRWWCASMAANTRSLPVNAAGAPLKKPN